MKKLKTNLFTLILIPGMIFLSCSALNQMLNSVKRPTVAVDRVHISGLSFDDIDLLFDLKVNNPNSIKVSLAGFDYDFFLNGNSFVKGQQDKGLNIEAKGESIVQIPINLKLLMSIKPITVLRIVTAPIMNYKWDSPLISPCWAMFEYQSAKKGCCPWSSSLPLAFIPSSWIG